MAVKKGPVRLSEGELIDEVVKRLNDGLTRADVAKVVKALKAEIAECVTTGYKVGLTSLFTVEPVLKPGRKKGTVVRNPFDPDAKPRTLRADEPDQFMVKLSKSSALKAGFPTIKSAAGQQLADQLRPAKRKTAAKK